MGKQTVPAPVAAVLVAPGASSVLNVVASERTREHSVYLRSLATGIDPTTNADFATIALRVNEQPFYPFHLMTSQIAPISNPKDFNPPIYLGDSVSVDLFGTMAAGAVGNTKMYGGFDLLIVPRGEL
jgi:hypothetical protein